MLETVLIPEMIIKKKKAEKIFDLDQYKPNTLRHIILQSNKKTLEGTINMDHREVKFNLTDLVNWELTEVLSGVWLSLIDDCTPLYVLVFTEPIPEFTYFFKRCTLNISNTGTADATVKGTILLGRKEEVYEQELLAVLKALHKLLVGMRFPEAIPMELMLPPVAERPPVGEPCEAICYPPLAMELRNLGNCINKIIAMLPKR